MEQSYLFVILLFFTLCFAGMAAMLLFSQNSHEKNILKLRQDQEETRQILQLMLEKVERKLEGGEPAVSPEVANLNELLPGPSKSTVSRLDLESAVQKTQPKIGTMPDLKL